MKCGLLYSRAVVVLLVAGKEAVKALIKGKEISSEISETICQISKERESMEFVMERYLEEFIEENFYKINFGAKLELYQDEENNGRQYSTLVGNIDLLAMDRNKKKFVIIELKKGKSNDVVVGQILRYLFLLYHIITYFHSFYSSFLTTPYSMCLLRISSASLSRALKSASFGNPFTTTGSSISTFKLEIIPLSCSIILLPHP